MLVAAVERLATSPWQRAAASKDGEAREREGSTHRDAGRREGEVASTSASTFSVMERLRRLSMCMPSSSDDMMPCARLVTLSTNSSVPLSENIYRAHAMKDAVGRGGAVQDLLRVGSRLWSISAFNH
jgi:hypothetical protein